MKTPKEHKRSDLEQSFITRLIQLAPELPEPAEQHVFDPRRGWALDFSWPSLRVAVEIEGGTWNGGRHVRGKGYAQDCAKYNALVLAGWSLLRYTSDMIDNDPVTMAYEVQNAVSNAIHFQEVQRHLLDEITRLRRTMSEQGGSWMTNENP